MHIEVVPKLDTDSCLNAIMRFIARRGKLNTIISDNGTNLVGAEREFAEYVAAWIKEGIEEHLIQRGIRWKVNPRSTTLWRSMGVVGQMLQESNVCSVSEQISDRGRSFNNDVFCRADIERKTPVSSDVNDLDALTPNHFLLGNRNVCLPYLPCAEEFVDLLKKDKLKHMQISYGTDFVRNICQL